MYSTQCELEDNARDAVPISGSGERGNMTRAGMSGFIAIPPNLTASSVVAYHHPQTTALDSILGGGKAVSTLHLCFTFTSGGHAERLRRPESKPESHLLDA